MAFNLEEIENNYQMMSDSKLIELTKNPEGLRFEVFPLLQRELIKRGKVEEALSITNYLTRNYGAFHEIEDTHYYSDSELKEIVSQRLAAEESLESIKADFEERGIDLMDNVHYKIDKHEASLNYLTELKNNGLSEEEINENLEQTLSIINNQIDLLKANLRARGKRNLAIGFTGIAFILIALIANVPFRWSMILWAGISLYYLNIGSEQIKK